MKELKPKQNVPSFDPNLSPRSEHNRKAAEFFGVKFDRQKGYYVDSAGAIVRDQFGQPV